MRGGIAALPMYDWPELEPATDRLWAALRDALRDAGIAAPDRLTRGRPLEEVWLAPDLVLGQTCGLPIVRGLAGRVALIGALDYQVPGCPPGHYRSAVVVRADDPRDGLAAFRGARLALNGRDSQSGYGAILHHAAPLAEGGRFFGSAIVTGAHAASIRIVAGGGADIAAIDAVTWRIARRFMPERSRLRVLMLTDPTPGLPLIAARGADVGRMREAVGAGLAALDERTRAELGIAGLAPLAEADYAPIGARADAAEAVLAIPDAAASA